MAAQKHYDLILIGAGPGGYVAAERAGAKGMKVLLVEKAHLGGVCLNEGCIPSKTLLHSAKLYSQAGHSEAYGVSAENVRFDLEKVMARKRKVIETLRKGIAFQMKHHKVDVVTGKGELVAPRTVRVEGSDYTAANVMIATGSSPMRPPIPGSDQLHVLTSTEVLQLERLPKSMAIIGGGVIGCEFASFFSQVGVKVSVVEMLPEILPNLDAEIAGMLRKSMKDVDWHLGCKVEKIGQKDLTFSKDGKQKSIDAESVLMCIGRKPNLEGLGLEAVGVDFDRRGIRIDDRMRTNVPGIWAIGDVTGAMMLAHTASRMGEVAVNNMKGQSDRMRYHAVPWVVYTSPEIAGVGHTEATAREKGLKVLSAKLPMSVSGRFLAENEGKRGLCKVVVDAESRVLLGVHMIGSVCSEIIYGAAAMIEGEFRVKDIQEVIFPHPTVGEVFRDALFGLPQ